MITSTPADARTLQAVFRSWQERRLEYPHLEGCDFAKEFGISEARLYAARCAYGGGRVLAPDPAQLLAGIVRLGTVTAVTRSVAAKLQNVGTYGVPDIGEHTGIVIGDNIDLRIFPSGWRFAYALVEDAPDGPRRSVHIFDAAGSASHEIVLDAAGDALRFDALTDALALPETTEPLAIAPAITVKPSSTGSVDVHAYRRAYAAMQDTHDFFMLLHRFSLAREEGLRLAGPAYAHEVTLKAHRQLFTRAAEAEIPLMIFVANSGMVQISSGPVPPPTVCGSRCSITGSRFSFDLQEADIARSWAVQKPTVNGIVTSLELYASNGDLVVQIFGERHAGATERPDWADAIASLPTPA